MNKLLALLCCAPFLLSGQTPHQHHPPASAEAYAKVLENPSRDAWQKPHEVIEALQLRRDEAIADIGAGTGYFARRFARHAGKVYAVDIDARLLKQAVEDAPGNLTAVHAAADDPKLAPSSVDTIFFCNVLHHIDGRPAYYAKLSSALKAGGRIVMIDFQKRELPMGPPVSMKLSEEEVIKEMAAAGFVKTKSFDFLPHQYYLVFERRQ